MRRGLDATDLHILRLLQHDAEYSMQALAAKVGLSHTPCWRRYRRLKKMGVIVGHAAVIEPKKVGVCMNAICDIVLQQHHESAVAAFEQAVVDLPEIVACFAMAGPKDYTLRVAVTNLESYERFFKEKLLHLPGVAHVNTSFAFSTVKSTTALPL